MSALMAYLLGIATPFALLLVLAVLGHIRYLLTAHDRGWGCYACHRRWGFQGDGSAVGIAWARKWWHVTTAHPGVRGRLVVMSWRGWQARDWRTAQRVLRAFPDPPVTVWDLLARIPLVKRVLFAVADRHGKARA